MNRDSSNMFKIHTYIIFEIKYLLYLQKNKFLKNFLNFI